MAKKHTDKYSVPGNEGEILPNLLGLTTKKEIDSQELLGFIQAPIYFIENLSADTEFNMKYLNAIHKRALGHLYSFAGKLRTVNMSKGGFAFPAARFLSQAMEQYEKEILSPLSNPYADKHHFIRDLAKAHAELLFIHPYREGNGRTARLLTSMIYLKQYKQEIDFSNLLKDNLPEYIKAVQDAAQQDYSLMEQLFLKSFMILPE